MRAAIDETDRRRQKQVEYNAEHGIVPTSVARPIKDILEGARDGGEEAAPKRGKGRRVAEPAADYARMSPQQIASEIKSLEERMYKHARDLEFEDAARLRDELQKLKAASLSA